MNNEPAVVEVASFDEEEPTRTRTPLTQCSTCSNYIEVH